MYLFCIAVSPYGADILRLVDILQQFAVIHRMQRNPLVSYFGNSKFLVLRRTIAMGTIGYYFDPWLTGVFVRSGANTVITNHTGFLDFSGLV